MYLVTALHRDGGKFIIAASDITNKPSALIEMRDRDGRLLGNKIALRDIVCTYHGPLHGSAFPELKAQPNV